MANLVYLSKEWAEEGRRRAEAELTPEVLHNVTSSMNNIYRNCPDGKEHYFYVAFEDGKISAFETGEGEALANWIIADYDTFARISGRNSREQRDLAQAVAVGQHGQALRLAPLVDKPNKVIATIPTDY